ncbi:hypothetical protein PHLCEN_2v13651 [Hermanssonia centrifuga]|uniref:NADH dehydrogenase [ubiquinone] iron-sulfur protein 4, mitochondrial n=1 Tax=Hermanssonia centrifuga TaxID=98765 RepID=A0A2R6NDQ6_9APHY|nr:hypothetical protein PHLCEN_2v13651 [Hermanssonia centrifuga]
MSLLRPCQQSLFRHTATRTLVAPIRSLNTDSNKPATQEKASADIVPGAPVQDVVAADIISGAPAELRHRAVRIFQPTRSTTQSGTGKSSRWRIDWDILQGAGRWENRLMGWASSADYMQGTRMSFRSKEDAVHFAEKQGEYAYPLSLCWDYFIEAPEVKSIPPKNYAENFVYRPNKLRICRTK